MIKKLWPQSPLLFTLTAFCFSVWGCTPSHRTVTEKPCLVSESQIENSAKPGSGALIATDISGSFKGFVLPNSTRLFTLHDELDRSVRNAIATSETSPGIQRCYIGIGMDCQTNISTRDFDRASTYSANESRLDLFFAAPKEKNTATNKAADPIDPYHVAVLITDGMEASAANSNSAEPCLAGADPRCMAYLMKQRAENGYGIWAILLLMPFKGTHYAERPLDDSQWQRIQEHVSALSQDSFFQGVKFTVSRQGSSTPFTSYQFEGAKPVLVLVVSRDIQAGRSITNEFSEAVKRERVVQPSNGVYTMELAPLSVAKRKIEDVRFVRSAPVHDMSLISHRKEKGFFNLLAQCDRGGSASFDVITSEAGGANVIPEGVRAQYVLSKLESGGLPAENLKITEGQGNNLLLTAHCDRINPGQFKSCLTFQATLSLDDTGTVFWQALSSENMFEAPERLYGLKEMIRDVLKSSTQNPRPTDAVMFTLERK